MGPGTNIAGGTDWSKEWWRERGGGGPWTDLPVTG